jgi:hypothetical protein
MHFVKQFVKKGGSSFDKTVMRKYNECESAITANNAFNNLFQVDDDVKENLYLSINEDFQLEYDNNKFYLFQKCKTKKNCGFSHVEANYFIDCLLAEVYKVCTNFDDASANSSFFRLHCYYENMLGNQKQIVLRNKTITNFKDFLFFIYKGKDKNIIDNINIILSEDELSTAETVSLFLAFQNNFSIYTKAIIFGLRFTARGMECIETENPTSDNYTNYGKQGNFYMMNNTRNDISCFLNWSLQYSSWCRYRINKLQFEEDFNPSFFYGQLNYFFRFHCPSDIILHGLPIANLVPRSFLGANTLHNPLGVDKIPCEKIFHIPKRKNEENRNWFVPLTNFCSTAILIVPFDDNGTEERPIYIKNDNALKEESCFYSKSNQINYILAFDLHPNRKYSTFDVSKLKRYNKFSKKELDKINVDFGDEEDDEEDDEDDRDDENNENLDENSNIDDESDSERGEDEIS